MSLKDQVSKDMITALKAGEKDRLQVIRMLKSRLQEREVERRAKEGLEYKLTDEESLQVIGQYAKQRRDSITQYREVGRDDLAEKEAAELALVEVYMPKQMNDDEIREAVTAAVAAAGASSMKDIGAVMKVLMPQTKGKADGKRVNQIVRELLDS